jgi:hypothetical protein
VQQIRIVLTIALLISVTARAWAQTAPPTLQKITPTGAQRGTEVTVTIVGTNVGDATRLIFSEPGFTSRITAVKEVPIESRRASFARTRRSRTRRAGSS